MSEAAGAGVAAANPYAAAFSAAVDSPPPSSAANLTQGGTYNPKSINVTGLNLGSILQPFQGPPNTGGYGYDISSPMGANIKPSLAGLDSDTLKKAGIAVLAMGGLYILVKLVKR